MGSKDKKQAGVTWREELGRERGERILGRGRSTWQLERGLEIEGTGRESQCGWSPESERVRRVWRGEWVSGGLIRILDFILEIMGIF